MPYRKSYRRGNGRPGYKSCGRMVYNDAKKALALARHVKGLVNVEFKENVVTNTATAVTTSAFINSLDVMAQGDTDATRSGNLIRVKSIQWEGFATIHASAANTSLRIMVILDKQSNGANHALADILNDATAGDAIVSSRNIDGMHRFIVLYDRKFILSQTGQGIVKWKFYKKVSLPIRYDGNAGNITDLASNNITLVMVSNEATNAPAVTHSGRIRFIDN